MKTWLQRGIPVMALALMLIPSQSFAADNPGSLGSAMKLSIEQNNLSFSADADLKLRRGGETDLPFSFHMKVNETGGKQGSSFQEKGNISFQVDDLDPAQIPAELAGASYMKLGMDYMGTILEDGLVTYVGFENIKAETDSAQLMKMMNIFNEMIKFMDGKWMKFSTNSLSQALQSSGTVSMADAEALSVLEGLSNGLTIRKLISSLGSLMDSMIESGVLIASKSRKFGKNRFNASFSQQTVLTYTFGNEITAEGAQALKNGIVEFTSGIVPMFGEEIARELESESNEEVAMGINEMLQMLSTSAFEFSVVIAERKIVDFDLNMDLTNSGIPLTFTQTMQINYGRGPEIIVPAEGGNLIDFDKVLEGVSAMAQLGSSSFGSQGIVPPTYGEPLSDIPEYNPGNPYSSTQTVMNMFYNACGSESRCRRGVAREMIQDAKQLYDTNRLTKDKYKFAINTIREANRRQ